MENSLEKKQTKMTRQKFNFACDSPIKKGVLRILSAALLALAALNSFGENKMHETLSKRDKNLATVAAWAAKGDLEELKLALKKALEEGIEQAALKSLLVQTYAYCGFPRSLNALSALMEVQAARPKEKEEKESISSNTGLLGAEALEKGTQTQTKLCGAVVKGPLFEFAPAIDAYLKAHLFGDVFSGTELTWREREIATVAMLSARAGLKPQLEAHIKIAKQNGVKEEELTEIQAIGERARIAPDFSVWPKGEPNSAYAKYFIGNSFLAPLGGTNAGLFNVTFEPRCRNNWHVHHKGIQVLVCVAGRGWYQEFGKEAVEMKAGSVIAIPAEVKHWHGAAKDSWFQHLTYMTQVKEGASNEWLEPVTDEVYEKLP